MTDADLIALLSRIRGTASEDLESDSIEFKGYANEAALMNDKTLALEISALANRQGGGTIVVGVRDSSNVPHGHWSEQLQGVGEMDCVRVQERLKGRMDPPIGLKVRSVEFEGRLYVAIEVPHESETLVATRAGKYGIRDGRSSRPMSPTELKATVRSLATYDWSAQEVPGAAAGYLDPQSLREAIADFQERRALEEALEPEDYLEAVGATRNGVLSFGGVLFLGTEEAIQTNLSDYEYRFSWKTVAGELALNDVWSGNLWRAIKRARAHFNECNSWTEFEYQDRSFKVPLLDPVAFHEGFLNALVHRDYASPGMVSVDYVDQYLHITSPGDFFGGVTAENIVKHQPRHRNRALAKVLMNHHLVDRAGMGVVRMGVRSLTYGRAFPRFSAGHDSVAVAMQAEYLRPEVFVLTQDQAQSVQWGIPELVILNSVYERGYVPVSEVEDLLSKVTDDPWGKIRAAVEQIPAVEFCGTNDGLYVRVGSAHRNFLKVSKNLRVPSTSAKHVQLYAYLRQHGDAHNADITSLLGYSHTSGTARFLRKAKYVRRTGRGPSARWSIR